MDNTFGVRLVSAAGFSRIEVPKNSTFLDLKNEISKMVNVHPKEQKIYLDMKYTKILNVPDITSVLKLGVR
jgi:hypothetical protein